MIPEYIEAMRAALKERNYPRAAGYLRMIYQNLSFHFHIYRQIGFEGFSERDVMRLFTTYAKEFPGDPSGYMMLAHMYHNKAQLQQVRRTWRDTCENAVKGFHFQPSVQPSIFDAEKGRQFTSLSGLGLGTKVSGILGELGKAPAPAVPPDDVESTVAEAVTLPGEPAGVGGVTLNGRLAGFVSPTRYCFRYGASPDNLTERTETRDMPAGLHGRARDTAENLFRRISANTCNLTFSAADLPERTERFPVLAMTSEWPFGKDRNHRDGIGVIDLLLGWSTHAQQRGWVQGMQAPAKFPTPTYPGEAIDLRDARVTLTCRTSDLVPKGFRPVIWMHGRTGTAVFPEQHNDLCAWAVTAPALAQTFPVDGAWHSISFDLSGASTDWTFCGSNVEEMGDGMLRYTYAPLADVQRANAGGNLCVAFVGGDELETPEGSVDIAALELTYRSRSLIGPNQQAELVSGPGDAGCLTDGTVGDIEHVWNASADDGATVDLIWRLRGAAELTGFKLHQNVLAPARDLEIAISDDGAAFTDVWSGTMDDIPEDPAGWGEDAKPRAVIRAVVMEAPVSARYLRLRIISGQRPGIAGLDAFEVFGDGLPFVPSPSPFSFSEVITGLDGDEPLYAQLVAESGEEVFEGDVIEIARAGGEVPVILSAAVLNRAEDTATVLVRAIGMGEGATVSLRLHAADGEEIVAEPVRIGKWRVPADNHVRIAGLSPGAAYICTCVAENEAGTSEPFRFELPPGA